MEHTPGPWTCEMSDRSTGGYFEPSETEWLVVIGDKEPRPTNVIASFWDTDWGYEALYNARLIAAAPDLLEACKVALNAINLNDETVTARKALDAAIEKAEGKPTLWAKEMT